MSNPQETEVALYKVAQQNLIDIESRIEALSGIINDSAATEELQTLTGFTDAYASEINADRRFQRTIDGLLKAPRAGTTHHVHAMPGLCTTIKNLERESLTLLSTANKDSADLIEIIKEATAKKLLAKKYTDDLTKAFISSVTKV
mmetsp:Transcript_10497/g.19021  ORF Transcript_10497/g.19021 Transcript_10497/m.19021 type:complete len:145 (+) Transcript_10497:28-462(+)